MSTCSKAEIISSIATSSSPATPETGYFCALCDSLSRETNASALFECSGCGAIFNANNSYDPGAARVRCPDCYKFARKVAEDSCAECEAGAVEQVQCFTCTCLPCEAELVRLEDYDEHCQNVHPELWGKECQKSETETLNASDDNKANAAHKSRQTLYCAACGWDILVQREQPGQRFEVQVICQDCHPHLFIFDQVGNLYFSQRFAEYLSDEGKDIEATKTLIVARNHAIAQTAQWCADRDLLGLPDDPLPADLPVNVVERINFGRRRDFQMRVRNRRGERQTSDKRKKH